VPQDLMFLGVPIDLRNLGCRTGWQQQAEKEQGNERH
jgi:hypothetical protein